jgi:uncharacterized membrane protein
MKKGANKMENAQRIINLVLRAVAVGMSIVSIVLGFLGEAGVNTHITLLGIGLAALAISSLQTEEQTSGV